MKFRRTNKVRKFEVKKVKNKGAVSKNVVPRAKGNQRDREGINDVSSNMKTSELVLSAPASPCCK